MDTIKIKKGNTKLIAHRGLSGIELMNTCAAFVAAGNRDYFGIETDVHVTSDKKFVVIHDDNTKRVSNINVEVEKTDYATLRSLPLKENDGYERCDLKIPSLEEYLRICARYEKTAVLELKNPFEKENIQKVIDIVKETIPLELMTFISFDYQNLCFVREFLPDVKVQFLCGYKEDVAINDEFVAKLKVYNMDLDIEYHSLTEQSVRFLHENGIEVNCWTVDDPEAAENLVKMGVDYITTNILQ